MKPPAYTSEIISRGLLKLGREGIIRALGSWPTYAAPPPRGIDPFLLTPRDAEMLASALDEKSEVEISASKKSSLKLAARFLRQFIVPVNSSRVARHWIFTTKVRSLG